MPVETPVLATSRLAAGYREVIEHGRSLVPQPILDLIHPHFLTGIDPKYVGLHSYGMTEDSKGGTPYSVTAHTAYRHHQDLSRWQQVDCIVLPLPLHDMQKAYCDSAPSLARVVIHELGHVLHARFEWELEFDSINEYAETDSHEAFAEAFESWVMRDVGVYELAPEAVYFFDSLAR